MPRVLVPPIAVDSSQLVKAPSFVLAPTKGTASLQGRLTEDAVESALCCKDGLELAIVLADDDFVPGVGAGVVLSSALLGGLRSLQDEPTGWNAVIGPALQVVCRSLRCIG